MKNLLRLCLAAAMSATLHAQQSGDPPAKIRDLAAQNNHREAADLGKQVLASTQDAGLAAEVLDLTFESLSSLGAHVEQEKVIEDAAARFPQSWRVLLNAGIRVLRLPSYGEVLDGEYRRGGYRGGGRHVQSQIRDRTRALQLLEAAWKALPADATSPVRLDVLHGLESALRHGRNYFHQAWSLQVLTDLSELPDYDDQSGLDSSIGGYPVDAEGHPVFFKAAQSWESAASDGERLLWIMEERERMEPASVWQHRQTRAVMARQWFSVNTLAYYGIRFDSSESDESETRGGIASLHTLKDGETTARLTTGAKRFELPAEWAFLHLLRAVAESADAPDYLRVGAWSQIAEEMNDRRQYPRASEALRQAIALEKDTNQKAQLQSRLDQITGNLGRFDPLPPQPAGTEAKLSLVFRNARKIELSARRVDVGRLLDDTEAYLRGEPQDRDWQKTNLGMIGRRLLEEGGDKYLAPVSHTWTQGLEPRANHWDRRVDVPTPLKEAGAWLVEGAFEGGGKARALLWLESLNIVHVRQPDGGLYYIADAVTGEPVRDARVKFMGYRSEWARPGLLNKPRMTYNFKDFQASPDEHGQIQVKRAQMENYQWLIRADTKAGGLAFLGFAHFYFGGSYERFNEQAKLYAITDRPVYRPGQEVKWKAWARMVGYDSKLDTNAFAGSQIKVTILDPRGEKLVEKTYKADDSGAVSDALTLGEEAALGVYNVQFEHTRALRGVVHLGSHSFRVEEYKKPEFEVKVDAPVTPVALGDSFEVKVKADYYFGGPVKQGTVKYKVQRSAHTSRWFPAGRWDWLFGSGYGWRATYYDWYPGARSWCFCIPRWPWIRWQDDPPELVAEGEAALNADGTFTVKIDTALAKELHGNEDHRYEIEAEVTDQSRRAIFGKSSVLAARRPFEVYVSTDRGYYTAGQDAEFSVHARTLDGREVAAEGTLVLYRVTYDQDGKPAEEAVHTADIKLDESSFTRNVKTTLARGGQYRVSVKLKDKAGHEIEGVTFLTVRGAGFDEGKDFRFDDLELLVEREEYAPGDEVEVTVNTNRPGSTVALFLRVQNGLYPDPVWLHLEGKSTTHRFKITEADQPNFFLDAFTVNGARVHQVTRQILVPPKKRIATVELEPDAETYLPGQGSKVKVRVKDADGKPFTGRVVLTAYDKALEYISGGSNQEDIRPFFWGWKRSHYPQVRDTLHALETGLLKDGEKWMEALGIFGGEVADDFGNMDRQTAKNTYSGAVGGMAMRRGMPMPMAAPAPMAVMSTAAEAAPMDKAAAMPAPGGGGAPEEGPQPMIRTNLADSAVWVADFTTDAEGMGELAFNLPENLTTWKLRSWVMGPQTQVGEASVEVITRKNFMVRLQAPRFFVEKDEVVISANVHNELDTAQDVRGVLELEGGVLEFAVAPQTASVQVPAHGEHRFDWRVKVTGEGEARLRVKALAQKDSDAMEMTFPAYIHGMLKTDSWSLALRPDQASGSLTLNVPAERRPRQSRLEVVYSPTLAMTLVDALPYLASYPYGCTEQTLNRFVPTVITLKAIRDLGVDLKKVRERLKDAAAQAPMPPGEQKRLREAVFSEAEVEKMARTGVSRLLAMRNADGGWGWFPGGRESSAHITALVLHGMKAAERAGFDLNEGLIRNGVEWLTRHEAEQLRRLGLPQKDREHKSAPDNLDALIHSVLVEYSGGDPAMRARLYDQRAGLSRYNLALLGLACDATGERERRDMCLRNLRQFLKQDDENQTAWLDLPEGGWWWFWYEDRIETQAAFLRLLVKAEPKGETAARLAKYIVNNRRNGTWWTSTKDTAAAIEALAEFAKASGESAPAQTVEILLDGVPQKRVEITPDTLFTFDNRFVLEGEALTTGAHKLQLRKLGASPLYVSAYLTVFTQEDMIPAAGLEVKAERRFYRLIEEKPDQQVAGARGQVVTQRGLKYRREALASDAEIRSGDLIEVELSIESKNDYEYVLIEDMKPAGFEPIEVRSGWSYEGLAAYREFRDERVAFFAERLPRGRHNLSYRVKAEIPGRFSALPARIEAMYAPELKGNSQEWKARIVE
ncbi:MAG TPA: MG2 domain-containing protein [Prosthecobacter sp.]|nr:MG2 domain-containing protein [Prosthecobacter sp.]HRK13335.1 MG2 domain-containing protein [Prosthecobacter sp.]